MEDIQLSPHFKLSEFENSSTARARGINNKVPECFIPNIKNLCNKVLEPLRQHFDVPIIISSGYRCPKLNTLVGGVSNSQHMKGEAADIHVPLSSHTDSSGKKRTDTEIGRSWMTWVVNNTEFDQCIWETADRKNYWIHISCKIDNTKNRHQVISYLLKNA